MSLDDRTACGNGLGSAVLTTCLEGGHAIAADLFISDHTVRGHLQNIFGKLGVSSRSAATSFAFQHDLI